MLVATDDTQALVAPAEPLAPDPLQPFTPGGPAADLPVTAADLDRALTLVLAHSPDQDALTRAARKGRAALTPTADGDTADAPYIVEANGVVQILGSSGYYTVTDSECYKRGVSVPKKKGQGRSRVYCKGFIHNSGLCYHVVARELLRLAQVLTYGADTATADDEQAQVAEAGAERAIVFVEVAPLAAAIAHVHAHGETSVVTLDWNEATSQLRLRAGLTNTFVDGYGSGMAALTVDPTTFLTLLQPALDAADEPECGLRFGTAPIVTLITSSRSVNLCGAHLI